MEFNAEYIDTELEKIGARIRKPISIYLIGGCAMSFRNLKESTKDVDIVFRDNGGYVLFRNALFGAQYHEPFSVSSEHEKLEAAGMFENRDGFHLDLFVGRVVGKLALSKSMIGRAEAYKTYANLTVHLLSKEDVFLFKGLASEGRKRDLPDMKVLYPNLDWGVIKQELQSQHLGRELGNLFMRRLQDFSQMYQLDVPILAELKKKYRE